jgi:hypothetical protein
LAPDRPTIFRQKLTAELFRKSCSHSVQTTHAIWRPFPGRRLHPASYRKANSMFWCGTFRTLSPAHRSASRTEKTKANFGSRGPKAKKAYDPTPTPPNLKLKTQKRDPFRVHNFFAGGLIRAAQLSSVGGSLPLSERPLSKADIQ